MDNATALANAVLDLIRLGALVALVCIGILLGFRD